MGDKRAVCVGINYPGTSAQLSGCVNDANDWETLLSGAGYQVTKLLDASATKAAIIGTLREEVSRLGWGDKLVFTYSGHGTWLPDRNGDEIDGRDEALCPIDFMRGNLITDDELNELFGSYPTGSSILLLSDSCHSGTLARSLAAPMSFEGTPRFQSPAVFMDDLTEERAADIELAADVKGPRKTTSLISGCADAEYSYDAWFGSRANGAMTRAAIDSYRSGISLSAWYKAIRAKLPSNAYPQTPQLTSASLYRKYSRAL